MCVLTFTAIFVAVNGICWSWRCPFLWRPYLKLLSVVNTQRLTIQMPRGVCRQNGKLCGEPVYLPFQWNHKSHHFFYTQFLPLGLNHTLPITSDTYFCLSKNESFLQSSPPLILQCAISPPSPNQPPPPTPSRQTSVLSNDIFCRVFFFFICPLDVFCSGITLLSNVRACTHLPLLLAVIIGGSVGTCILYDTAARCEKKRRLRRRVCSQECCQTQKVNVRSLLPWDRQTRFNPSN